MSMPLDLRRTVLVNEPSLVGFYRFPASRAGDCLSFSEKHVGLTDASLVEREQPAGHCLSNQLRNVLLHG